MQLKLTFVLAALAATAVATPIELRVRTGGGSGGSGGGTGSGGSGPNGGGNGNTGSTCGNGQVLACCQNNPGGGSDGLLNLGGLLAGALQCSPINVAALGIIGNLIPINSQSVCQNHIACCTGDVHQNGVINLNAPCTAVTL